MANLEKFKKLGFACVEPTNKDKIYFFAKHVEKDNLTVQMWIELKKKTPIVDYKVNYVSANLPEIVEEAVSEFLGELGYTKFKLAD